MTLDFQEDDDKLDFQLDFQEEESSSKGKKNKHMVPFDADATAAAGTTGSRAIADFGASMLSGLPAQIASGLAGAHGILSGKGVDESAGRVKSVQDSNFGLGQYKSITERGGEMTKETGEFLEKPVELAMKAGEAVGGNEGAYIGELITRSAMEMIDPALAVGAVSRLAKRRKSQGVPEEPISKDKAALDKLDFQEDSPTPNDNTNISQDVARLHDQDILGRLKEIDEGLTKSELEAERVGALTNETTQTELFDQPDMVQNRQPFQAEFGDWRIDENGMPVKADLSMDAANAENPLQRNLFGDELPPKSPQEDLGIMHAMDDTRNAAMTAEDLEIASQQRTLMEEQQNLLSYDIAASPHLQRGMLEAELRANTPRSESPAIKPSIRTISPGGKQTGAINLGLIKGMQDMYTFGKKTALEYLDSWKGAFDARAFDSLKSAIDNPSPDTQVSFISPREFHTVANLRGKSELEDAPRLHERIKGALESEKGLFEVPELWVDIKDGVAKVVEHEGRHRMDVFRNMDLYQVPVVIRIKNSDGSKATTLQAQWTNNQAAQTVFPKAVTAPRVPRGQRGSVSLNALTLGMLPNKNPLKKMGKQKDGTMIPDDPTPDQLEAALEVARDEKDGNSLKYMDSGAQLTALKRGSTAIKLSGELVQNAFKRADLHIRKNVFPAESALRKLSRPQLEILGEVFKKEMFNGSRFDKSQLEAFTPEIQNGYRIMREMFDDSIKVQNAARVAKGQSPITPMEAYLSSRWNGDFRRPLYNKDGKLVWYLAGNTKMNLDAQTRAVLKDHPDLTYDPKKDHTVRYWNRKTDLESAYTTMVDILGRDDPSVAVIKDYMESETVGRGATFLNQEKHFKHKGNVRGFVGDRPELTPNDYTDRTLPFGDSVTVGNKKSNEMLDMFQQQIQYAKNAYRWSELQVAGQSLKKIINDPHLTEHQPKNVSYIREYFKNAIGYGESRWARVTADTMRDLGVSPKPFDDVVGGTKSYFILSKLAGNAGYLAANIAQIAMTAAHMADLFAKGHKANPLRAYTSGILGGFMMGTGHIANSMGGKMPDLAGAEFFNSAAKYAEDNGITARSIYDESPIESSFSTIGRTANVAGRTMTIPETFVRSMAFMSMAQYLKDAGKFKSELELFKEAERRTNVAMVDYASTERPMIFSKLGSAGNFLNTLQTFSWNFFNQFKYFSNEARKGNVMPIAVFIATQYMVAGAMGVPGVEDSYKLWMKLKDMLPATTWKKIQDNEFLSEPKLWMLKNAGTSSVYGYLSDKSGLGLTSRLAAPGGAQMLSSPAGPITDIAGQVGSVASLAMDPTNTTKQAQAAMNVAPTGLKGLLETAPFMEGQTFVNRTNPETGQQERLYKRPTKLEERQGLLTRTPQEENIRKWGFGLRAQSEQLKRDVEYATKRDTDAGAKHARSIPDVFYDALRRGDKEKAKEYYQTYVYITGNKISKASILTQAQQESTTDSERQKMAAKKQVQAMINVKRMEDLFDAIEKESK